MSRLRFFKGHALGNDYIVIDSADLADELTPARARLLCDRHRGIGSDGVLLADAAGSTVGLRIINPDGTEAEKSGNGLRIFGAYLYHHGRVRRGEWFDVALSTDTVAMSVEDELDDGHVLIRVRMGRADFTGAAVAFAPESGDTHGVELDLGDAGSTLIATVSLGNPHCVIFVDELVRDDFVTRAPRLCTHPAFERGTNVQFARVVGPHEIEAWIWERGAGETLASGSSACAVAAAAVHNGLAAHGRITVRMPGGSVEVGVDHDRGVELLGPAGVVYEGAVLPGRLP